MTFVGTAVGATDGCSSVGSPVGAGVGDTVGTRVGVGDGAPVGVGDGAPVGSGVGMGATKFRAKREIEGSVLRPAHENG